MTMNTTFKRIFVGQNLGAFVMSSMLFNEKKVTCFICVCVTAMILKMLC